MATTVTVDDATRRRLKRLAAAFDVTQKEIIGRALDLLESQTVRAGGRKRVTERVDRALAEASKRVRTADSDSARIARIIEEASIPLEEFVSRAWGKEI